MNNRLVEFLLLSTILMGSMALALSGKTLEAIYLTSLVIAIKLVGTK